MNKTLIYGRQVTLGTRERTFLDTGFDKAFLGVVRWTSGPNKAIWPTKHKALTPYPTFSSPRLQKHVFEITTFVTFGESTVSHSAPLVIDLQCKAPRSKLNTYPSYYASQDAALNESRSQVTIARVGKHCMLHLHEDTASGLSLNQ